AFAVAGDPRFFTDIGESAVAVVVIENIFAKIADEQIIEAVVVVVADADALSPAGVCNTSLECHVGKGAVAIVLEEMRDRFLANRKTFEPRTINEKNIEPAVVVVIVERNTAARGFEQIFVLMFAAVNCFRV